MVTRPVLPVLFRPPEPAPGAAPGLTHLGRFTNIGGLGDMELPLLPVPPWASWGLPKNLILALAATLCEKVHGSNRNSVQRIGGRRAGPEIDPSTLVLGEARARKCPA